MAANKRTKLQREEDREEIADLHNRGYSSRAIRDKLNAKRQGLYSLTQQQIVYDLETISQRFRDLANLHRMEHVQRQRAQLREVRREAWEAWEASKENREKKVTEKISESLDKNGNPTAKTLQKLKAVITTEGRLPASEYLAIILRTFEREAALLGLDAPAKIAPTNPDGTKPFEPLSDEERVACLQRLYAAVGAGNRSVAFAGADGADGSLSGGPGADSDRGGHDAGFLAGETPEGITWCSAACSR